MKVAVMTNKGCLLRVLVSRRGGVYIRLNNALVPVRCHGGDWYAEDYSGPTWVDKVAALAA